MGIYFFGLFEYVIEIGFCQDVEDFVDWLLFVCLVIEIMCFEMDLIGFDVKVEVLELRFMYIVDIQCFGFVGENQCIWQSLILVFCVMSGMIFVLWILWIILIVFM